MRNIILISEDEFPKLAIMADKISNITSSNEICSASIANNCSNTELLMKIQSFEQQIVQMTIHHISRPQMRNNSQCGKRSRSNSR